MDQTEYAESVINKYAHYLGNRKVKKTPLPSNVNERISQEEICRMKRNSLYSTFLFLKKVGALLYLTVFTRPNLSFAVNTLSRLSAKKTMASCLFAIHVLLHLKGITDQGITFSGSLFDLYVFSDADWTRDRTKRRSMTGYVIFICGGPRAWMSKLQCTVATVLPQTWNPRTWLCTPIFKSWCRFGGCLESWSSAHSSANQLHSSTTMKVPRRC